MTDEDEVGLSEEIDLETTPVSVVTDWPPQIGNGSSLLIPQPVRTSSRSNSMSSQVTDHEETNFYVR